MHQQTAKAPEKKASSTRMQAAVLAGSEQVELQQIPRSDPGANEVRVRLEGCGVCASDLPVWEGRAWFDYPREPGASGHEGWGRVEAVGSEVTDLAVGDRVALLSHHAYAECDTVPASRVVRLPDALSDVPFPGEPLGCAMNVFRRSAIRSGENVAIVGIGFLGALLTQLATEAGAKVVAISRRRFALDIAEQFGAEKTFSLGTSDAQAEQAVEQANTEHFDCVIEATGKQKPLNVASQLVRIRGRLIIAGYHQDGPRQVDMQSWNWRGIDVINAHERDPERYIHGMFEAVDAVASGRLDLAPLCTHTFPLRQLADAFRLAKKRPDGFMKALVTM